MSLGDTLYERLGPVATDDAEESFALRDYTGAVMAPMEWVATYAVEDPPVPGYGAWMDHDTCPVEGLGWLGQFVGVYIPFDSDEASARALVGSHPGFRRGTPGAITAAAQATLTGNKTVILTERSADAYTLQVITYTAETPNAAATQKAIVSQKPAGIVLTYATVTGKPYQLFTSGGTYAWLLTTYPLYSNMSS